MYGIKTHCQYRLAKIETTNIADSWWIIIKDWNQNRNQWISPLEERTVEKVKLGEMWNYIVECDGETRIPTHCENSMVDKGRG